MVVLMVTIIALIPVLNYYTESPMHCRTLEKDSYAHKAISVRRIMIAFGITRTFKPWLVSCRNATLKPFSRLPSFFSFNMICWDVC